MLDKSKSVMLTNFVDGHFHSQSFINAFIYVFKATFI